jgi:hypothetical protein
MKHRSKAWYAVAGWFVFSIIVCALGGDDLAALVVADTAANVLTSDDDEE